MNWIKVSDRSPELGDHILLYDENEKICVGYRFSDDNYNHYPIGDFATGALLFRVTHWMSLPAPPKD